MNLDIVTLMTGSSFVAGVAALALGGASILMRERALAWWALSQAQQSIGVAMLAHGLATVDPATIAIGAAVTDTAAALVWAGARTFGDRHVPALVLAAAVAAVPLSSALPFAGSAELSARLTGFLLWVVFLTASIRELWRGRQTPLPSRWPLMVLFTLHAIVFTGGIFESLAGSMDEIGVAVSLKSWFGIIHFEALVYSIGTTSFMVMICKERSERVFRDAAWIDSLTGAASRSAFMAQAGQLLARCRKGALPLTLVVFDLDRFKTVNDTYGHKTGDRVLRVFADSARKILRPNDLLGRHGGEEFALVLPAATIETGYVIAERIRVAFSAACRQLDEPIPVTVSAGVATIASETTFDALMEAADAALYQAKNLGRNRVERAGSSDAGADPPKVIRVA